MASWAAAGGPWENGAGPGLEGLPTTGCCLPERLAHGWLDFQKLRAVPCFTLADPGGFPGSV